MISFGKEDQTPAPKAIRAKHSTARRNLTAILGLSLLLLTGCHSSVKSSAINQDPHDIKPIVKPPAVAAADPSWFGCQADSDCTVKEGVCGEDQAVNTQYVTQFFSYRDQMSRTVGCIKQALESTPHTAQCVQHRCSLNPPRPQQ